mmetsp:Transcript_38733/g.123064  ORF Transcript_38733/g.123064 Transcript_38733/m.123064 type:complete len:227 (-) Transcript_38733:153-833(-)
MLPQNTCCRKQRAHLGVSMTHLSINIIDLTCCKFCKGRMNHGTQSKSCSLTILTWSVTMVSFILPEKHTTSKVSKWCGGAGSSSHPSCKRGHTVYVTCSKDIILDGADHVLVISSYNGCMVEESDRELRTLSAYLHTLFEQVSNGAVSSLPQFLAEHRFRGRWDQESNIFFAQFELLATTGGSILLSASLTPAHRFVAHEVAEELLLESESHGEGAARRLMVWSRQ